MVKFLPLWMQSWWWATRYGRTRKIDAIRELRRTGRLTLKDAKTQIERWL